MQDVMKQKVSSAVSLEQFEKVWDQLAENVSAAFNMNAEQRQWLKSKDIARLIAAIPIMAGCENAERTAVTHVATYLMSTEDTKHYFNPSAADNGSIFDRLSLIGNFQGGNRQIIEKGMSLLALTMLNDYKRDIHIDETLQKYNPLGEGAFEYEQQKSKLEQKIRSIKCAELEAVYNEAGTEVFWGH